MALGVSQHDPNIIMLWWSSLLETLSFPSSRSVLPRLTVCKGDQHAPSSCAVSLPPSPLLETVLLPKSHVTCSVCCHWHCWIRAPVSQDPNSTRFQRSWQSLHSASGLCIINSHGLESQHHWKMKLMQFGLGESNDYRIWHSHSRLMFCYQLIKNSSSQSRISHISSGPA